jgi:hypothetical protein
MANCLLDGPGLQEDRVKEWLSCKCGLGQAISLTKSGRRHVLPLQASNTAGYGLASG